MNFRAVQLITVGASSPTGIGEGREQDAEASPARLFFHATHRGENAAPTPIESSVGRCSCRLSHGMN